MNCFVLPNITGMTQVINLDISTWTIPKDIKLADEQFNEPGSIDLLLGADLCYEMSRPGRNTHPGNYPIIQETILGWTLAGKTLIVTNPGNAQHSFIVRDDDNLKKNLNRFWEVEPVDHSTMTAEQKACEDNFLTHTTHQPDGRFMVTLPTKMDTTHLGTSRLSAERRLHAIESRLERDPVLKKQYHDFMKEYEELGHMESVTSQEVKDTRITCPIIQSSRKQAPQQELELCLMEEPKPPMEFH
jgi:hypothetical protein